MGPNSSRQQIIEDRRREVAALRRRRFTIRQIAAALKKAGRVNVDTGQPWSVGTIKGDLDAISGAVRAESLRDVSEHKAEILADYHELLRIAWRDARYDDVRQLLRDVRQLLGTDAPQVVIHEQMALRMEEALSALEREFRGEPEILERALDALTRGAETAPSTSNRMRLN